jgi:hypothetical protein
MSCHGRPVSNAFSGQKCRVLEKVAVSPIRGNGPLTVVLQAITCCARQLPPPPRESSPQPSRPPLQSASHPVSIKARYFGSPQSGFRHETVVREMLLAAVTGLHHPCKNFAAPLRWCSRRLFQPLNSPPLPILTWPPIPTLVNLSTSTYGKCRTGSTLSKRRPRVGTGTNSPKRPSDQGIGRELWL